MKSNLMTIIYMLFSVSSFAQDDANCSEDEIYTGKLFQLEIKSSFGESYKYQFCVGKENSYLISTFTEKSSQNLPDLIHTSKVKLTNEIKEILKEIYQSTVLSLPKDNSSGMDGSTWCFKPKSGMSYSNFCYWSPESNSSERGLSKLYELRVYIHELSGLK